MAAPSLPPGTPDHIVKSFESAQKRARKKKVPFTPDSLDKKTIKALAVLSVSDPSSFVKLTSGTAATSTTAPSTTASAADVPPAPGSTLFSAFMDAVSPSKGNSGSTTTSIIMDAESKGKGRPPKESKKADEGGDDLSSSSASSSSSSSSSSSTSPAAAKKGKKEPVPADGAGLRKLHRKELEQRQISEFSADELASAGAFLIAVRLRERPNSFLANAPSLGTFFMASPERTLWFYDSVSEKLIVSPEDNWPAVAFFLQEKIKLFNSYALSPKCTEEGLVKCWLGQPPFDRDVTHLWNRATLEKRPTKASKATKRNDVSCSYCERTGHTKKNCWAYKNEKRNATKKPSSSSEDDTPTTDASAKAKSASSSKNEKKAPKSSSSK